MRNALSEHLEYVVVSTNRVRHALHEACLGSLEKQKKSLLKANKVHCNLEFAQCHQALTNHDWCRVILGDETKINQF